MILSAMFYAGIGSRKTPQHILDLMEQLGYWLAYDGMVLRSGHAPGADQAFERGVIQADGPAEIFLPWRSFESGVPLPKRASVFDAPTPEATEMAGDHHPAWGRSTRPVRALHARNCHQILGYGLRQPVLFVLCWTPGARKQGGTAQAIRIAEANEIPVYNLADPQILDTAQSWVT